jgi:thioredoxin reductase (NADPH)
LKEAGIDYINAKAQFKDRERVHFKYGGKEYEMQGESYVIATGVRPRQYESIPELREYAITSDDLFSLKENPGKTLVIGGGYIAVECAGFLVGLGNEVILANRSSFLRVFDSDMAFKVEDDLAEQGISLLKNTLILSVTKLSDKLFEVQL